jgi:BMFP domain-containing protein YqiC
MAERPRFFDDLAGVAGGAFSALAGMREEVEATIRARVDEAIRKLDLVKREDLEAVQEMAALARAGQEAAEHRLAALEAKFAEMAATASSTLAATDGGTPFEPPSED